MVWQANPPCRGRFGEAVYDRVSREPQGDPAAPRKSNPDAPLSAHEARQLRAILGSFQWLVAQLRFDMAFQVSVLQGEEPTIGTIIGANRVLKEFKRTS